MTAKILIFFILLLSVCVPMPKAYIIYINIDIRTGDNDLRQAIAIDKMEELRILQTITNNKEVLCGKIKEQH
ncbi:MAG: hypothetical protein ACK4TA_12000 [Saprospiraceae bacterium]